MDQIDYTAENPFLIEDEESAASILYHFNDFHDGFIKRVEIMSNDYFEQRDMSDIMSRSHIVTSKVELQIDIAHYNYGAGGPPFNRHVCLHFTEFYDLNLNIGISNRTDWIINEINMNKVSRPLDTDPAYAMRLFDFTMKRSVYDQETGWVQVEESLFKFANAIIWEEDR